VYKNRFSGCRAKLTEEDLISVERSFGVTLHPELREYYLFCKGGSPEKKCWEAEGWDPNCLKCFLPIKPANLEDENFADKNFLQDTLVDLLDGPHIPENFVPFGENWGGDYFCVDGVNGEFYFFEMDCGDDFEEGKWFLTSSLRVFIDGLVAEE
jgi:hypothetical protein